MVVRIAQRSGAGLHRCSQASRTLNTTSSICANNEERNIFVEAEEEERLEQMEGRSGGRRSLLEEQRAKMAQEPVWNGDERLQDTILRMVMDKYQPLRIKGGSGTTGQHPADVKLATIQKPSILSGPSFGQAPTASSSSSNTTSASSAAVIDVDRLTPETSASGECERRLAKTPEDKPWAAVYVNPMRTESGGESLVPSVHYGKYLGLPRFSSARVLPKTATGKEKLKLAGIKLEALPFDDRNKMKAIREGVRRWDRAGRMRGVKEEAFNYRRMREEERNTGEARSFTEEEIEEYLQDSGILQEGEEMKLRSSTSDSKPGEAIIAMSGGRGFTSVANERIEAAMKTDYFRRNALRGKPLERDIHAMNPFLKGEERIMNRLIQRQGAAPPWVELNSQVESETTDWRNRVIDNWLRRASRMILSSAPLRRGLEPVKSDKSTTFTQLQERSLSTGQRKLLNLVEQYRDQEWVAREKDYHEASLKEVNNIIRKYNVVAPQSVRKGLLTRERELQRVFDESKMRLVARISEGLLPSVSSSSVSAGALPHRQSATATKPNGELSNSSLASGQHIHLSNRAGAGISSGGGDSHSSSSHQASDIADPAKPTSARSSSYGSWTSIIRRLKEQFAGQ